MRALAKFPSGHEDRKWRRSWKKAHARWQSGPLSVLRVTAHLARGVVMPVDGRIHLDAVLVAGATAVVNAGPSQRFGDDVVVPAPLKLLWVSPEGWPLWAASDLRPEGETATARDYWHGRYPDDRAHLADKMAANTSAGRWKEYRVPLAVTLCQRLTGICIGHAEDIPRLLDHVSHLGKKASTGHGRVLRWQVEAIDMPEEEAVRQILASRPVPVAYYRDSEALLPEGGRVVRRGWTPPYWMAPRHAEVVHG